MGRMKETDPINVHPTPESLGFGVAARFSRGSLTKKQANADGGGFVSLDFSRVDELVFLHDDDAGIGKGAVGVLFQPEYADFIIDALNAATQERTPPPNVGT